MQDLSFEERLERLQIAFANVGNGPVGEIAVAPMDQVIAFPLNHCLCFAIPGRCWPNKQINEMFAPLVNQSRSRVVIEVIKASAKQRKTVTREIQDGSCKIKLGIEPWFNSVLISGCHVGEMIGHERADVTGDELRRKELIGPGSLQSGHKGKSDDCSENDRGG